MSNQAEEFRHEALNDASATVRYLRALADGLDGGTLVFRAGEQQFSVSPHGLLGLTLKGRREGRRVRLSVRLSWKEREETPQADRTEAQSLVIETTTRGSSRPAD